MGRGWLERWTFSGDPERLPVETVADTAGGWVVAGLGLVGTGAWIWKVGPTVDSATKLATIAIPLGIVGLGGAMLRSRTVTRISREGVAITRRRLLGTRRETVPLSSYAQIVAVDLPRGTPGNPNASSNDRPTYEIHLRHTARRGPSPVIASLGSPEERDRLVDELAETLDLPVFHSRGHWHLDALLESPPDRIRLEPDREPPDAAMMKRADGLVAVGYVIEDTYCCPDLVMFRVVGLVHPECGTHAAVVSERDGFHVDIIAREPDGRTTIMTNAPDRGTDHPKHHTWEVAPDTEMASLHESAVAKANDARGYRSHKAASRAGASTTFASLFAEIWHEQHAAG
jgi:hypothetical protein